MSNLIPITRIYDIYPKYTYSNDVKKFMDEIVDIDRANVFTKADMVNILNKIRAEIKAYQADAFYPDDVMMNKKAILEIIDKHMVERSE